MYGIEVKTKPRLNKWAAQGFNIKQYKEYKRLKNYIILNYLYFLLMKKKEQFIVQILVLSKGFHLMIKLLPGI